ncbi:Putative Zn-dependent protease [alpha proteobacterium BAL199]|jgi:predicted Zn-dependent protease|nr:Putative Zn-dependent protease [alpha proteobacterium BAL199]
MDMRKTGRWISCVALTALMTLSNVGLSFAQGRSLIRDAEIEATIRDFATPLFQAAGLVPDAIDIFIIKDDSLNAFVAGGQNLFIHTGLLMRTKNPLELIGVIAHETGHISGGHLARTSDAISSASTAALVATILGLGAALAAGNAGAGAAIALGGSNFAERSFLEYSRTQESSADQAGLTFLEQTGQSAEGMVEFLHTLAGQELLSPSRRDPYLNTHPLTRDRIASVEAHVERSRFRNTPATQDQLDRHARMVAKLFAFIKPPAQTFRKYPEADTSLPARYARAIAYYEIPDLPKALELVRALNKDYPNDPYFHELEGQIQFENGHPAEALPSYETAHRLAPHSGQIEMLLARNLLALNDPTADQKALKHMETAIRTEDDWSSAWRQLAIAYGRVGRFGDSALSSAEEAIRERRWRDAEGQAKRAQAQLPKGSAAALRALDIEDLAKREFEKKKNG